MTNEPARDAVEPDLSWIDIAVCRNATVIMSYSPGWAEFIDELHFEDMFECDVPDLVNGLYRWAGYKIGFWGEDDHINVRGGTFTPYALTTASQGIPEGFKICPDCGLADVSLARTCDNSSCTSYADEVTVYRGWDQTPTPPDQPAQSIPEGWPDIGPDPFQQPNEYRTVKKAHARLRDAYALQQPIVPSQTALVWRDDIGRVHMRLIQLEALLGMQDDATTPAQPSEYARAIEDAAKVAESRKPSIRLDDDERRKCCEHGERISASIRALSPTAGEDPTR